MERKWEALQELRQTIENVASASHMMPIFQVCMHSFIAREFKNLLPKFIRGG